MTNALLKRHDPLINKLLLIDESQSDALLQKLAAIDSPTTLAFLNQHAYNLAQQNLPMRRRFCQMSYLMRDGIGVKIACKLNGRSPKANMNGSDFIPKVIDHLIRTDASRYQFFALGTREPWLSKGARKLFQGQPFHAMDGFQPEESYAQYVERHCDSNKVPVIVLAMGMPKQEDVAIRIKRELDLPALLICGGAILDFSAERFTRAPMIFRKTGMEWVYRLGKEPKRLFRRYVIGIPQFFYYVGRNGFGSGPRDSKRQVIE